MRRILIAIAQWMARNPQMRDQALGALDTLRQRAGHRTSGSTRTSIIEHLRPGQAWDVADGTRHPAGTGAGTRTLVWMVGGGALLLWVLLMVGASALWFATGDWAIVGATSVGRTAGLPLELAEPIASALYLVRNFGGPVLTALGVVISAVILGVTALTARVLSGSGRG